MHVKKTICLYLLFLLLIFCCSCGLFNKPPKLVFEYEEYDDAAADPNEEGKTGRLAVLYGDWIYYRNNNDRLYRIRTDGTDNTRLTNDFIRSICVTENWVYYINYSDRGRLYRMRPNGTERKRLLFQWVYNIHAVGDWVFFNDADNNNNIFKIRTDGTGHPIIVARGIDTGGENRTKLSDGWIYHFKDKKYYRIRTDGTDETKLTDDFITFAEIAGGMIYYINNNDNDSIYKMRTDGTEQTKLMDEQSNVLSVSGDWIFYCKVTVFDEEGRPSDGHLYKMRLDGTDKMLLNEAFCTVIEIAGDWIYFIADNEHQRMRTDGTDIQKLDI